MIADRKIPILGAFRNYKYESVTSGEGSSHRSSRATDPHWSLLASPILAGGGQGPARAEK